MKNYKLAAIAVIMIAAISFAGCQSLKDTIAEKAKSKAEQTVKDKIGYDVKTIEPAELDKMKSEAGVQIVDVRSAVEAKLGGDIEGAVKIPAGEIGKRYTELDKEKKIVVVGLLDTAVTSVTGILLKNGFKKVYKVKGGFEAYKKFISSK